MSPQNLSNFSIGKAGLTGISGAATTYSIGTAVTLAIDGKLYARGTASGATTPTTDAVSGSAITLTANYGTVVVWGANSAGTVQVIKGSTEALDASGNFLVAPQFPALPDTFVPFAYTIHKGGSTLSGTFTFGSSNWNTTGMTHVVQDICRLPSRPQVS